MARNKMKFLHVSGQITLLSFFLILCFPWSIIPFPGMLLQPLLEFVNTLWIPLFGKECVTIYSDSLGMQLSFLHVLLLVSILCFMFRNKITRYSPFLSYWTSTLLLYFLIFFLLKYGLDKVFKHQFPFPEPNVLYTPIGKVSKGLLYWSSVGSSYSYNFVSGFIECLVAILLIINKTRLLGLLLSFLVMCNIVLINFSFDIDVKILSSLLLLTSLTLLFPYQQRILSLLNIHSTVVLLPSTSGLEKFKPKKMQWKIIVIMLLLFDVMLPYFETNDFNSDKQIQPKIVGAFKILQPIAVVNGINNPTHCFVNSRGYLIFQNVDFQRTSVACRIFDTFAIAKTRTSNSDIQLTLKTLTVDNITIGVQQINIRNLQLKK
jgi:hypothetical protein